MKKFFTTLVLMGAVFVARADKKVLGINFEDSIELEGKKLSLNGVGIRNKEIALGFKVNVYAGALYLEKLSGDYKAIMASTETKLVRMVYTHSVDKDKLRTTWQENFDKYCVGCEKIKPILETFKTYLEDMEEDFVQEFVFVGSKIKVTTKKKIKNRVETKFNGELDSAEFQKFLLSIWLDHAPNLELKTGMLGLSQP